MTWSALAEINVSSTWSLSTWRSVYGKPLLRMQDQSDHFVADVPLTLSEMAAKSHFSLQVFSVHSAYSRAEGSAFARIPTRCGGRTSLFRPSDTSASNPFAMLPARTTLQEADVPCGVAIDCWYHFWNSGVWIPDKFPGCVEILAGGLTKPPVPHRRPGRLLISIENSHRQIQVSNSICANFIIDSVVFLAYNSWDSTWDRCV